MRIMTRLLLFIFLGINIFGYPSVAAAAANLSNTYQSTSVITSGSMVSLDPQKSGFVMPANQTSQNLIGVATTSNQSLLAISSAGSVQVALSGVVNVFVSTLNGPITVGSQIGVSPINGVGMNAEANTRVIGIAQAAFNTSIAGTSTAQVTSKSGKTSQISVGIIPVVIAIGTASSAAESGAPSNFLQKAANSIAGHKVSAWPLVISTAIIVVTFTAVIVLIYGTIRGSLVSVGRNPLAKPAIFASLAQVLGMISLIVIVSVISVYFILR